MDVHDGNQSFDNFLFNREPEQEVNPEKELGAVSGRASPGSKDRSNLQDISSISHEILSNRTNSPAKSLSERYSDLLQDPHSHKFGRILRPAAADPADSSGKYEAFIANIKEQCRSVKNLMAINYIDGKAIFQQAAQTPAEALMNCSKHPVNRADSGRYQVIVPEHQLNEFQEQAPEIRDEEGNIQEYDIVVIPPDVYQDFSLIIEETINNHIQEQSSKNQETTDSSASDQTAASAVPSHDPRTTAKRTLSPKQEKVPFYADPKHSVQNMLAANSILKERQSEEARQKEEKKKDQIERQELRREQRHADAKQRDVQLQQKNSEIVQKGIEDIEKGKPPFDPIPKPFPRV